MSHLATFCVVNRRSALQAQEISKLIASERLKITPPEELLIAAQARVKDARDALAAAKKKFDAAREASKNSSSAEQKCKHEMQVFYYGMCLRAILLNAPPRNTVRWVSHSMCPMSFLSF